MRYDAGMKKNWKINLQKTLLGGIDPRQFLEEYWQKKPLLIRAAIPGFTGLLSAEELAGLACEEDVQSRLVTQRQKKWRVEQGPFEEARFLKLPEKDWTLLVQGVNHHMPEASALLQQFDFIPHARLDDLMVSYAPDGGGVGPHFDSYDVFLLQGEGKRLWRVSEQKDLTLVDGAALRILENFQTEQEWLLEAGDMLYLPPHIAHWGIAVGDCMTYSIGFRAPSAQELVHEFLGFLQERYVPEGMYADPDLELQQHPAKIGTAMLDQVAGMLNNIRWNKADVAEFLGRYLSEPKSHVMFDHPASISESAFHKRLQKKGIDLSLKSQLLFHEKHFFMNGEQVEIPKSSGGLMRQLADQRHLAAMSFTEDFKGEFLVKQLHEWYLAGYLRFPE
jgi:50S ribosomal protein L16 3-hydroxylase